MSKNKAKKGQDERTPATEKLLKFLQDEKITLIIDTSNSVNAQVKDILYTVEEKPRLRVFYLDQINQEKNKEEEKVNLVN